MKCSLFPFFFSWLFVGGGDFGSGSGSKFNRAARVGSGQTISGTGRVRASVLSPCRPLALSLSLAALLPAVKTAFLGGKGERFDPAAVLYARTFHKRDCPAETLFRTLLQ